MATSEISLSILEHRIPPELLNTIFEEAVDVALEAYGTPRTYSARALCLVSKTLLPFGQQVLFRSVTLRFGRYGLPLDENGDREESDQEDDPAILVTNDKPFLRALREHPSLRAHVRELILQLDWLDDEQLDDSYVARAVGDVLSLCRGIVRLSLRGDGGDKSHAADSVLKVFADGGRQLEELSAFYPGEECWKLLTKSKQLRRLDLTAPDLEEPDVEDWDTSASFPSPLTYLRLHQGYSQDCLVFSRLFIAALLNSLSTLQELHISSTLLTLPTAKDLLPLLSNLRLLVVNANHYDHTRETEEEHYRRASTSLASCSISSLHLWMHPRKPLPAFFFPSLPRSIIHLDVRNLHVKETGVTNWIEKAETLNLKSLKVIWPMATEHEPQRLLAEACERRNVEFWAC